MITEWMLLNEVESKDTIVREKALESPMGYFFLVETFNKATNQTNQTMAHVQCNRVQFKFFIETRLKMNKERVGTLLRLYNKRRK